MPFVEVGATQHPRQGIALSSPALYDGAAKPARSHNSVVRQAYRIVFLKCLPGLPVNPSHTSVNKPPIAPRSNVRLRRRYSNNNELLP